MKKIPKSGSGLFSRKISYGECRQSKHPKTDMDVSKNRGTPKWMVKIMENPLLKWMIWEENPLFSEIPTSCGRSHGLKEGNPRTIERQVHEGVGRCWTISLDGNHQVFIDSAVGKFGCVGKKKRWDFSREMILNFTFSISIYTIYMYIYIQV